jgi:hypothetical protein
MISFDCCPHMAELRAKLLKVQLQNETLRIENANLKCRRKNTAKIFWVGVRHFFRPLFPFPLDPR